jgi:hypothetical protein
MRMPALIALGLVACRAPSAPLHPAPATAITPDLARIDDGKRWRVINGEPRALVEDGRRVVRLRPVGGNMKGSNVALALVDAVELGEGTIEIDLKGNGSAQASFVGVAFAIADAKTYEAVYFRPFNFRADDALHRGHAVQYIAWPEHTWEQLRAQRPGTYEAAVDPVPDPAGWFHARIDVAKRTVRVFVDDAAKPCLTVERLGNHDKGQLGLWVDSQESAFANLKIVPVQ